MFENLLREMKRLERGVRVPVEFPLDDNGHFERRCPSDECRADFRVHFDDWRDKVRDEVVFCPICRFEAESTQWNTPSQEEYFAQACQTYLHGVVGKALRRDSRAFNTRQPRGGLIQLSLSYHQGAPPIVVPPEAADALRQQFTCESCGSRYGSIGAAFFCPACGHNSALTTFAAALQTVRAAVSSLAQIKEAVRVAASQDAATDTARQILENSLVKLVASFQRYAEATFHRLPNASNHALRKNLFQNLHESSLLWRAATGKGYDDLLAATEIAELVVFFQQRHLLAHKEGIVDSEYLARSGDMTYTLGQKLVVKEAAVNRLANLVERLAAAIRALSSAVP